MRILSTRLLSRQMAAKVPISPTHDPQKPCHLPLWSLVRFVQGCAKCLHRQSILASYGSHALMWWTHGCKPCSLLQQQEAGDPEADLDYVVCSLDAMSGVAEALSFRFEGLLSASAPAHTALRDILLQCCQVPVMVPRSPSWVWYSTSVLVGRHCNLAPFEGLVSASDPLRCATASAAACSWLGSNCAVTLYVLIIDRIMSCLQDASADIRQSAFALVGDLAKVSY